MRAEPASVFKQAVRIPDGSLEGLKWIAAVFMVGDHINKYWLDYSEPALFALGRMSLPLFVFVLAYNLARPSVDDRARRRALWRLAAFGAVASVPFTLMRDPIELLPLNVLFTLGVIAGTIALLEARPAPLWARAGGALTVAAIGGAFVEYWWLAVAGGLLAYWYCRSSSGLAFSAVLFACASLFLINGNGWALGSIPFVALAMRCDFRVPRVRWFFYAFYPGHLLLLWFFKLSVAA